MNTVSLRLWFVVHKWTSLVCTLFLLFTPVLVDARTGELTEAYPMPWYLRFLELSRSLHFGDYGGMPLKILWALFDLVVIAVLVSGVVLWAGKRKIATDARLRALGFDLDADQVSASSPCLMMERR